jgi:hypothetical protein
MKFAKSRQMQQGLTNGLFQLTKNSYFENTNTGTFVV